MCLKNAIIALTLLLVAAIVASTGAQTLRQIKSQPSPGICLDFAPADNGPPLATNRGMPGQCASKSAPWTLAAQPPPPAPRQLGIFGQDPVVFGRWLGRSVDYVLVFGGQDNGWHDFTGSIWSVTRVNKPGTKLLWSAPLIPKQWDAPNPQIATLAEAAAGNYDDYYRDNAAMIAAWDPKAVIRIGWEFNGDWYPWRAADDPASYINAFRDYVKVFRAASSKFKFMWCPGVGSPEMDAERAYPGDEFVDYIGMDIYENGEWDKGSPDVRWNGFLSRQGRGLDWLAAFAKAHNKPISIPEWATNLPDPSFIEHMHDWMATNGVVMQSYWDCDCAFEGSFDTHPAERTLYRKLFKTW